MHTQTEYGYPELVTGFYPFIDFCKLSKISKKNLQSNMASYVLNYGY